jgi:predicted transcriptional regulator
MENVLTESQFKRIERLANDAGRSVKQIMPHVLKHGLLELERVVKSVKHGIADAEQGRTISHEQAMQEIDTILAKYEKKAA